MNNYKKLLFAGLILIMSTSAFAQKSYAIKAEVSAEGTSNTHDWTVKAESVQANFVLSGNNTVESLTVKIPVESLKSILESKFERKQMENLVLKAFNNDKNPNITFQITEPFTPSINGTSVTTILSGNLTMAGVTKKVSFRADGRQVNGGYQFKATIPLKFTDYGMKPPVALIVMRVKDPLTVKLDVTVPTLN